MSEMASLTDLIKSGDVHMANLAAQELQRLNWQPSSSEQELLLLLALNDEEALAARLSEFAALTEPCTHPSDRSFANHILEDMAYERGPFWPTWASQRAVALLQQRKYDVSWYVGRWP